MDSAHILPQDIIQYLSPEKWDVYYLGYPNTSSEDKIKEIKKYTKGGWTDNKSQEELLEIFNELIMISKNIQKICLEKSITFIDTSNKDILTIFKQEK